MIRLMFLGMTAALAFMLSVTGSEPASAITGSDWRAGNIVDDSVFRHASSMTPSDIQAFLNAKVPTCDTWGTKPYGSGTRAQYGAQQGNPAPYICLRDYYENPDTKQNNLGGTVPAGAKSAAQIIYDVGQQYRISPKVLLVLLQKEQTLITDDWPWPIQYRSATGYGCPDTAACDGQYYGFYNQVRWAARMFQAIGDNDPNWYSPYLVGNNFVRWSPTTSCGGQNTNILNRSTASLYSYTPYQPNQAALSNLYGMGDGCSAYGNRNFWRLFNDWFGSTISNVKIYASQYNATTDNTGSSATIGFSLNRRPDYDVTIPLRLSDMSVAGFASKAWVTITPDNWNKPERNTVVLYGKDSGTSGASYYTLITDDIRTDDQSFAVLTAGYTPDITLTNLNATSDSNVYRLYSPSTRQHLYTASISERNQQLSTGAVDEGVAFSYCRGGEETIHRLAKGHMTLLVSSESSELEQVLQSGYTLAGPNFSTSRGGAVPVYRLYHPGSGDHLYTTSQSEYTSAVQGGYAQEGVVMNVCSAQQKPVYRLYNAGTGRHFYTASASERDYAGSVGFSHEGVGFYLCGSAQNVPVHRLYSSRFNKHLFTASDSERSALTENGFNSEGIGFNLCDTTAQPIYRLFNPSTNDHFFTPNASEANSAARFAGYTRESTDFFSAP